MRDLEIRGAGSILGAEQSGHIAGVGFDLYVRLVGEAVTAFKKAAGAGGRSGEDIEPEPAEVRIELPVDASIPHHYVPTERLRLDAYRKIAAATGPDDLAAVRAELADRYGPFGAEVQNLFAVAGFRQACRAAGVTEVMLGPQGLRIGPVDLAESAEMRLARLYPGAKYKASNKVVTLKPPTQGTGMAAPVLRDTALLEFCERVIAGLVPTTSTLVPMSG